MSDKKRCPYCGQWYTPYARIASRQKQCGRGECARRHKRAMDRAWRAADPGWRQERQKKVREWARRRGYWRWWRRRHRAYGAREALRMRRKRTEAVAKQELLLRDPVGHLRQARYGRPQGVAKQDLLGWRLDETLEYLLLRERVAKQDWADRGGPAGV